MFRKLLIFLMFLLAMSMITIGAIIIFRNNQNEDKSQYIDQELLYEDIILGNRDDYEHFLDRGDAFNFTFEDGTTPIELLIEASDIDGAKRILDTGFDLRKIKKHNSIDTISNIMFFNESYNNEEIDQIAIKLVEQVKDELDTADSYGFSLLINAITTDNYSLVNEILKYDVEINSLYNGTTALHIACETTDIKLSIIQLLIQKGGDLTLKNDGGNTCIFSAIDFGQLYIVEFLVENYSSQFNLNTQNDYGDTILHHALYSNLDIAEYLTNQNIDFTIVNNDGETAKDLAVSMGLDELVAKL